MDRFWLLTNTCYGSWLPGDERGFIGRVLDHRPDDVDDDRRVVHNLPGIPYDEGIPGLVAASQSQLRGPPVCLDILHAVQLFAQFKETADFRGWLLRAVSIMFNHFHIVVGVPGDPSPSKILGDFKSWGTRRLTDYFGEPASKTWWTESGSKRKLPDEKAVAGAAIYALYKQPRPLLTWSPETGLHFGPPPESDPTTAADLIGGRWW